MIDPYQHIGNYINGRLTDEDNNAFKAVLSHDKELQLLVEKYPDIKNISDGLLELQLLKEVKIHQNSTKGFLSSIPKNIIILIIIAIAIIIMTLLLLN